MKCANSRMFTIGRGTIGKHLLTIKDLIERSGVAPVPLATASTRWSPIVMGSVSLMADVVKARSMLINTKGLLGKPEDDDNTLVKAPCPREILMSIVWASILPLVGRRLTPRTASID